MVKIACVEKRSRAERAGIRCGDVLVAINGNAIRDVLDYRFYLTEPRLTVDVMREGEPLSFSIAKGEYDDIGLDFETPLMDKKHTCANACIFCFIDQMPKGYRETLYFKDDDSRLSFLHGSYVTLTNMRDEDIDRIIKMRLSPINVSVHTTNPDLRVSMMKNKRAGDVLKYLDRIAEAGITLRAQIVLCRGINDGEELLSSMRDLAKLHPALDSVSVVPAGLTKYRDGLYPLSPYTPEECRAVIDMVEAFAQDCHEKCGSYLFHLADEFYLKAGLPLPAEARYEEYPQIENGVGMLTSFSDEFNGALAFLAQDGFPACQRRVSVATGYASYPLLSSLTETLAEKVEGLGINVYPIENRFFGPEITVSGLLTGKDMAEQLKEKDLGEILYIPRASLRSEGDLFLCGMSLRELSETLGVPVCPLENDGAAFLDAMLGEEF